MNAAHLSVALIFVVAPDVQKELCNEPWQQTRQVIINKHLLGLLDCSGTK